MDKPQNPSSKDPGSKLAWGFPFLANSFGEWHSKDQSPRSPSAPEQMRGFVFFITLVFKLQSKDKVLIF